MKKLLLFAILFLPSLVSAQAIKQGTTSSAGDAGSNIPLCVASAASGTLNTEGKYGYCSVDLSGNLRTTASFSFSGGTSDATKLEDAAHSSGDRGEYTLAVIQDTLAASAADNDYGSLKTDSVSALWVRQRDAKAEDAQLTDGLILPVLGIKRTDTVAASANAADDAMYATGDGRGLLYVNPWGANHTEWFRACSGSDVTGTTATEVVPATASKYNYLTGVNCTNTDATVNTRVNIVQETAVATEVLWSLNLAAIVGSDGFTFSPPLKATAVNKNIGVVPITTSAEVRCCMTGFVSAN